MMFVKVVNILGPNGHIDYKGLDIDRFVPGSQAYKVDFSFCILATTEELAELPSDVEELTQEQYEDLRNQILEEEYQRQDPYQAQIDALTFEILQLKGMV
jgi:hypothetical protein